MNMWRQGARAAASLALAALVAGGSLDAAAQERTRQQKVQGVVVEQEGVYVRGQGAGVGVGVGQGTGVGADNTFVFVSTEMVADGKVVKGAPYSADAVTETTQVLGDGNRIVRKNTAQVYRDGEGRTRRDQTINVIGPFAAAGDPPRTVFIHDPVAGTSYVLDPRSKTARKAMVHLTFEREAKATAEMAAQARAEAKAEVKGEAKAEAGQRLSMKRSGGYVFATPAVPPPGGFGPGPVHDVMVYRHGDMAEGEEPKVEKLERQIIEGVAADGTRVTHTIPAGAIGNEQPINIVHERWYSPDLQTTVMTRHSDPRFGETVYRLTNINRTEPARTLFEVPTDYTLKESGAGYTRTFRRKAAPADREQFQFHFSPDNEQQ